MENESVKSTKKQMLICAYCKRVLRGEESWLQEGISVTGNNSSHISLGIGPDCLLENFPGEYLAIQEERRVRIKNEFKKGFAELYGHLVK